MTEIHNTYSAITRQIREEAALCLENGRIDPELRPNCRPLPSN